MSALIRFLIVLVHQAFLKTLGRGNKVVGKGKPRSLASKGVGEVPNLLVGLAAGSAIPRSNQRFFDGHGTVEVRDKTVFDSFRDTGEARSLEDANLVEQRLGHLDQWCNLDIWPVATTSNDIARLAENHHARHFVEDRCRSGPHGFTVVRQSLGHLAGHGAMRTCQVGEMNKLQTGVKGYVSLTPTLESVVNRLFSCVRQVHGTSGLRLASPLGAGDASLGRNIGTVLLGLQKMRRRGRPACLLGSAGQRDTAGRRNTDALHSTNGLIETAVFQQVERRHLRRLVNGEDYRPRADLVTSIKVSQSSQHSADCSIMLRSNGLAVCPVMDASTRDSEQVGDFLPSQSRKTPDFQDSFGRRFHG